MRGGNSRQDSALGFGSASSHELTSHNVRHSNVSEDFRVCYTDFDALPNYDASIALDSVFENILANFASPEWLDRFHALDNLRILGKFYRRDLDLVFDAFGKHIVDALASPKTCVVKNTLAFLHESFETAAATPLNPAIVTFLLPLLLAKAGGCGSVLRAPLERTLLSLSRNCISDEMLAKLADCASAAPTNASRLAFHFLACALDTLKNSLARVKPDTLRAIFQAFGRTLLGPATANKVLCKKIVRYVHFLMGGGDFKAYLEFLYKDGFLRLAEAELLMAVVQNKGKVRLSVADMHRATRSTLACRSLCPLPSFVEINGKTVVNN